MTTTRFFSRANALARPSVLKKIEEMAAPELGTGVSIAFKSSTFHRMMAPSSLPESKIEPWGPKSKLVTVAECPLNVPRRLCRTRSQQRGEASPDDADALALTFAQHVAPIEAQQQGPVLYNIFVDGFSGLGGGWMR
jgi:hypothetical protein